MPKATEAQTQAARHVLYHFGHPSGYEPGSFTEKIMEAYTVADLFNRARLRSAFPEIGEAMDLVIGKEEGLNILAKRVE